MYVLTVAIGLWVQFVFGAFQYFEINIFKLSNHRYYTGQDLLESTGVWQSPVESMDSGGLWWTPFRLDILNWPMSHQLSPEFESGGVHQSPVESARVCRNPPEYVGQCNVLATDHGTVHVDDCECQLKEWKDNLVVGGLNCRQMNR